MAQGTGHGGGEARSQEKGQLSLTGGSARQYTSRLPDGTLGFHLFSEELDGRNQKQAEFVRFEAPMMVRVKSVVANLSRENTGFITLGQLSSSSITAVY